MNYYYKLFLWQKGQKSTDFTKYLSFPIFYEDRLNEQMDTAEVILENMPIKAKEEFPPKTKFRIERYMKEDYSDTPKVWDLVVEHDDVEEYSGCPELCCHRIHLIEPSAVTQGMHVDNIALTYELQDVTLNYRTYNTSSELSPVDISESNPEEICRETRYEDSNQGTDFGMSFSRFGYFKNSYRYIWNDETLTSLKQLEFKKEASKSHYISFDIPRLYCQGSYNGETWETLFEMNTITNVYRYETQNGEIQKDSKTLLFSEESGPSTFNPASNELYYCDEKRAGLRIIDQNIIKGDNWTPNCWTKFEDIYSKASIISIADANFRRTIEFNTDSLSIADIERGKGYYYAIECYCKPAASDGMLLHYESEFFAQFSVTQVGMAGAVEQKIQRFEPEIKQLTDEKGIFVKQSFFATDLSNWDENTGYMIMKGVKYSCYDLLRKALLTIDTQIINNEIIGVDEIEYFIKIDPLWEARLKTAKVQETILENKNFWEVLLQIGYYLHAIPYLSFAEDGTDRFLLSFRQLGDTSKKQDTSTKITIFNSKNLNDYFTQYDSYVTNIFSPQNLVEEWLVVKTNDKSSLVSNNTAILKTTYGISEIVEFDITYDGSEGGEQGTKSALSHIFEKSIYQILTADYNISPGMGDSLYYELGNNEIDGLTYVPPSVNGDMPMALKRIISRLFSGVNISELKFNNLKFHIKYRTQDSMRISQVRPDIQNFVKNSSYEKYPHHEQYFGQQDKIIDSERFSLNLYGRLIQEGNDIHQQQEFVTDLLEKESGDLVEINENPYYVTVVENEWYPSAIFQKASYSKNFNQLSYIVTIPSEPRFYEVSERSKIRREVRLFDFFSISTEPNQNKKTPRYLSQTAWKAFIKSLIFNKEKNVKPNYAWTRFKSDSKRVHRGSYNQYVPNDQMFPSTELDRSDPNKVRPKSSNDHMDCIVPLLHFPMKDGIQFEWDMEDNFKAGDSIDITISNSETSIADDAYFALQSVRYCDIMGRADLFSFRLFNKEDWNHNQSQMLPNPCIEPSESESYVYLPSPYYIALDKDGRCALSFNYQISMLYNSEFVTFSNLFGDKDSELYCCLLDGEVSSFNENTNIIAQNILADKIAYELVEDEENMQIEIRFPLISDMDISKCKSIVFYEINKDGDRVTYLAKNFKNGLVDKIPSLYLYPVFNE